MINLLLNLLVKQAPTVVKNVVNARRPLQLKAFASVFVLAGVVSNTDDVIYIIEYIQSLPQGNLLLIGSVLMFLFATKDVAGVVVNFRRTLEELFKTIAFIFNAIVKVAKLCKKKQKQP